MKDQEMYINLNDLMISLKVSRIYIYIYIYILKRYE